MPEYQLVPYTVQVNVRGKPDEFRPLDDLDGSRLGLLDVMAEIAVAHLMPGRVQRPMRLRLGAAVKRRWFTEQVMGETDGLVIRG